MRTTVVLLAVLALAAPSSASWRDSRLNQVASVFAMRPVSVVCYAPEEPESPDSQSAWGYVNRPVGKARVAHLDSRLCRGALSLNDRGLPAWQRAQGVMVLVHEAYHLRRWGGALDEAQVQCQAVRHWKVAARMLGATEETVSDLWPTALSLHYVLAEFVNIFTGKRPYYSEWCREPDLYEEP